MLRSEQHETLQRALSQLAPHYRMAVVLYDIEGMNYEEIAEIMDVPMGTVASRLHQGRVLLKRALKNREAGKVVNDHE